MSTRTMLSLSLFFFLGPSKKEPIRLKPGHDLLQTPLWMTPFWAQTGPIEQMIRAHLGNKEGYPSRVGGVLGPVKVNILLGATRVLCPLSCRRWPRVGREVTSEVCRLNHPSWCRRIHRAQPYIFTCGLGQQTLYFELVGLN